MTRAHLRLALLPLLIAAMAASALAQGPPVFGQGEIVQAQARSPARGAQAQKPVESAPEESVRKPVLNELFERLAASKDQEEADGIAGAIERVFQRSGSDTADLLLNRALTALHRKESKAAFDVLDKLVVVEPEWAEAWMQRATARFMDGDRYGAVDDLGQALSREPRHFGALSGLGSVLSSLGFEKRALEVYRRALAVRPHQTDVKQMIDKLAPDVDGRDI